MKIKEKRNSGLRVLILVDFLPNEQETDSGLKLRNIFIYRQIRSLALAHNITYPVLVPRLAGLIRKVYKFRGMELSFPRPREGTLDGIHIKTARYIFIPRLYPIMKARAIAMLANELKESYDLIHCHTVYDLGLTGLELKRKLKIPLLITVYGTDINWLFEEEPARRADAYIAEATIKALHGADAVIGVSRDLGLKVKQVGVSADKIYWVPNGVDKDMFSWGDQREAREKLGFDREDKIILFAGNIMETKGVADLVHAFNMVSENALYKNRLKLFLVGPDVEYSSALKPLIDSFALNQKIVYLGSKPHSEIANIMRASDLFCLPSWREGWPCTVLEAMACGIPVVATSVGGIPELIDRPGLGILCPPREPQKLAGALLEALNRSWNPAEISAAAEPYRYDKLALKIDSIYREVLSWKTEV